MDFTKTLKDITISITVILVFVAIAFIYSGGEMHFVGIPIMILGPLIMLAVYKAGVIISYRDNQAKKEAKEEKWKWPDNDADQGIVFKSKKNLRLVMVLCTAALAVVFLLLTGTGYPFMGVAAGVLFVSSPGILFGIYKAGQIIINPNIPNSIAIKGLTRLSVVCLLGIVYMVVLFLSVNWSVIQDHINYTKQQYDQQIQHIMIGIMGIFLLLPVAIRYCVKGYKDDSL